MKEDTMKSKIAKKAMMVAASAALFAAVGMTGTVDAATREMNIYGASAQYLFWNDLADDFLTSKGCSNIRQATDSSGKHGITMGDSCSSYNGDNVWIRYSSKASYDGIFAVQGNVYDTAGDLISWADADPDGCGNNHMRLMADETSISGTTVGSTKCVRVVIGASDVAGESLTQQSHGALKGPNGGTWTDRTFTGVWTKGEWPPDESTHALEYKRPVVVPFGFFANNSVTVSRCASGDYAGEMCTTATATTDCGSGVSCTAATLDNVTREMVVNIFSGQSWYWTDFGAAFPSTDIIACMRHAGSGTHATLDYAVVRGNGWGSTLYVDESSGGPTVWFNDGSSDEMKCVNQLSGAIGYADADQSLTSYTSVSALKYQGARGTRVNIRDGIYDFWSNQWLYYPGLEAPEVEPNYTTTHPVYLDMATYASDPANIPSTKSRYWATADEMIYGKATDQSYPLYQGAANLQTP
jgi:ABC-type phosphate transport system substrate-binding protein